MTTISDDCYLTDNVGSDFMSVLDDFMDEEVVDKDGVAIGSMACYWPSISGRQIFIGVKLKGEDLIRIVPGRDSQADEHLSCIRLGFEAEEIETAPCFDGGKELDAAIEQAVNEHFRDAALRPLGANAANSPGPRPTDGTTALNRWTEPVPVSPSLAA